MSEQTFISSKPFTLENGSQLPSLEVVYHTFGKLNKEKNNVIWACHALTANSDVFNWWQGLFGEKSLFNANDYFIVCANNLGSCYGTTGPLSTNDYSKQAWFSCFPLITMRDMVSAHDLLREHLGIKQIKVLIGGSQGAQQVLEWSIIQPALAEHSIIIASNAKQSPWAIAFNESQRLAIKADRTYYSNTPNGGLKGLAAARSIALLSYRNYNTYLETQAEHNNESTSEFKAAAYQRYQGEKLINRFNAYSYITLLNAMDSHNVGRARNSAEEALKEIKSKTLVIGIRSDLLFPLVEQEFIAKHIRNSSFKIIDSLYGHDGFLLETEKLAVIISDFLKEKQKQNRKTQLYHNSK